MTSDSELYGADILLWSEKQSGLLRRLAGGERVEDQIDWSNVVEEIEEAGRIAAGMMSKTAELAALREQLVSAGAPSEVPPPRLKSRSSTEGQTWPA
jgi:hypothetical protein